MRILLLSFITQLFFSHSFGSGIQDLKTVLMYFSEPFLKGATLGGHPLEGEDSFFVANKLCDNIEEIRTEMADNPELQGLYHFGRQLRFGAAMMKMFLTGHIAAPEKQAIFLEQLKNERIAVIPSGWKGHAVALIIKVQESNREFDLTVINTGDGIGSHHHHSPDPNKVYPALTRIWMEFKNIPEDLLFPPNAWFIEGLILMKDVNFDTNISQYLNWEDDKSKYLGVFYFYGTFINNLREYLVKVEDGDGRYRPMQRSGSCTVSSQLGALFYLSGADEKFNFYRLNLGHALIRNLLKTAYSDKELKATITDGFHSEGRFYFKRLTSSIANQTLELLETTFPDAFKHAGLIGEARSGWLFKNKELAIKTLLDPANRLIYDLLIKSVQLSAEILKYLEEHPIRKESTEISIGKDFSFKNQSFSYYNDGINYIEKKEISQQSSVPTKKLIDTEMVIENFEQFDAQLKRMISVDFDTKYFERILKVFKSSPANWWELLENGNSSQLQHLLLTARNLATKFAKMINHKMAFDDIVLLTQIQILAWKSAVEFNKKLEDESKRVPLECFAPPQTLQSVFFGLYNSQFAILSENLREWYFSNNFDCTNIELFDSFMNFSTNNPESLPHFPGPETYSSPESSAVSLYFSFDILSNRIHDIMTKHPEVDEILKKLRTEKEGDISKTHLKWLNLKDYEAKLVIIATNEALNKYFSHYYDLLDTLAILRLAAIGTPVNLGNSRWMSMFDFDSKSIYLSCRTSIKPSLPVSSRNGVGSIEYPLLRTCRRQEDFPFYSLRYTNAMADGLSIDDWLNYVKNAKSAVIFDEPDFQYLTDHLLNIDKFKTERERNGEKVVPVDKENAEEISMELFKLVGVTLNWLAEKTGLITEKEREQMIKRVTNISVILTRFVSKLDFNKLLIGNRSSKILVDLYNLILPFSSIKSSFNLSENEISHLNLVLAHICSVKIRNPKYFMNQLKIEIPNLYRKTLERYHWFLAKTNYVVDSIKEISDDQFGFGIEEVPLNMKEAEGIQGLLQKYFLIGENDSDLDTFNYPTDGQVIEITSSKDQNVNLILNLLTGQMIRNGSLVVKSQKITNDNRFGAFFKPKENPQALKGSAYSFGDRLVYVLPDFKGSSYIVDDKTVINYGDGDNSDISVYYVSIRRKWNGLWYKLVDYKDRDNVCRFLMHNWHVNVRFFTRLRSRFAKETVAFFGDETEPFIRVVVNSGDQNMRVIIKGMKEEVDFKLLESGEKIEHEKHFKGFDPKELHIAKDKEDNLMIFYPRYRLTEDPTRPFTLYNSNGNINSNEIQVLNVANMTICSNQAIMGKESIPGALLVTIDAKKVLLLPRFDHNAENRKSKLSDQDQILREYIQIEKIPVVNDLPAPQSRLHKLLLAYYLLNSHDYNSARELLSPNNLHQNEPFSAEELKVMEWIVKIAIESPEVLAMKLIIYAHFKFNQEKFPTSHLNLEMGTLEQVPENCAIDYLFAIRELSEKYYIYRIFPEILDSKFFRNIFGVLEKYKFDSKDLDGKVVKDFFYEVSWDWNEKKVAPSSLFSPGNLRYFLDDNEDKTVELELVTKLAIKRMEYSGHATSTVLAVYCYAKNRGLWDKFINSVKEGKNRITMSENLEDAMKSCKNAYGQDFEPLSQSIGSITTSFDDVWMVMKSDSKIISEEELVGSEQLPINNLVSEDDISVLSSFKAELKKSTGSEEKSPEKRPNYFDAMIQSKILQKLAESMDKFTEEKGTSPLSQIFINEGDPLWTELNGLKVYINKRLAELEKASTEQAGLLTYITSDISIDTEDISRSKAINSIISLMHHRKAKTFSDLYACYMRNSLSCIQKKFPQFDLSKCQELKTEATLFFGQRILIDFLGMLGRFVDNFLALSEDSKPVSVDDLTIFCDELSKIEDFNERLKDPVIMNFEFRSRKYRLKPEQVKDIELLTKRDSRNNFPSVVIQRMMAAGKTLVLGTISVVRKALEKTKLSILVPPASLYQSNTTAMQSRTYQYFKKKGNNFSFPRFSIPKDGDSEMLENYLDTVLGIINNTMRNRNYLILSPDSLSSFLNSYIEVLFTAEKRENRGFYFLLRKYSEIYRIFKESGSIILDEIDMTMDPRKELNFPTEDNEPYNMIAVALITDLIEFMIFDEDIKSSGLSIYTNDQASLTPENYQKCLKIVLDYVEKELNDEASLWYQYVFKLGKQSPDPESLMQFLRDPRMTARREWIKNFSETGNAHVADALIIVKSQLHQYLEESLKGTVNMNYGSAGNLRPEIKYAVPYVAANTPSPSSVFADRWETLLKTLLMVSASPCTTETAKEVIEYVNKAIPMESAGIVPMNETPTFMNMKLVLEDDLDDVLSLSCTNNSHVEIVRNKLALRTPAAIRVLFCYYINQVFDKMTFPVEQITSNALNLTSMFGSIQGYSGTIDNINILPQTVIKDAYEDHLRNEKNNGGISLKLIKDSSDGLVAELSEVSFTKSAVGMVKDLMDLYNYEISSISAIIDTGAFFKTFKNRQVAEAILTVCERIKAVLYYDEDSNQLEFLRGGNGSYTRGYLETTDPDDITRATQVELGKRFTFYDQRHITGSDILQPKEAHAIMTAGPRVLLRDILQGTLRMRQFMSSQKVHLVTTTASREFYCSKIGMRKSEMKVSDLLTLGALNEDEKQEQENDKLAFVKIDAEIRAFILDEVSLINARDSPGSQELANSLLRNMRSLFIRSIKETPSDWLNESEEKDSAEVLKYFAEARLKALKDLIPEEEAIMNRFMELNEKIMNMVVPERRGQADSLLTYLKSTLKSKIGIENGNEVQMQNLTLSLVDLDLELLVDVFEKPQNQAKHPEFLLETIEDMSKGEAGFKEQNYYWISLGKLYDDPRMEEKHVPLLQDTLLSHSNVFVTLDLIELVQVDDRIQTRFPIFSKYTLEGTHLLVQMKSKEVIRVFLVSNYYASRIKNETWTGNEATYWLCDLSGDVVATNDPLATRHDNILRFLPSAHEMVFDALIFNGSLPQILANDSLKAIYYDNWLKHPKFLERAQFLLLRMRVLMQKDGKMFEEQDEDYVNLQKYARGDPNPGKSVLTCLSKGYPKGVVKTDQSESRKLSASITSNMQSFDLISELKCLFGLKCIQKSEEYDEYDESDGDGSETGEEEDPFKLVKKRPGFLKKKDSYGLNKWEIKEDVDLDETGLESKTRQPRLVIV